MARYGSLPKRYLVPTKLPPQIASRSDHELYVEELLAHWKTHAEEWFHIGGGFWRNNDTGVILSLGTEIHPSNTPVKENTGMTMSPSPTQQSYASGIVLGETYRDTQTGYEGVATAVYFYQYGCERVELESFDKKRNELKTVNFDVPRVQHVGTGRQITSTRTGGPQTDGRRSSPTR